MRILRSVKVYTGILFLCLVAFSCKDDEAPKPERVLVSAEYVLTRSASEQRLFLSRADLDFDLSVLKYDVDMYRITYKTKYKDQDITASALVSLPLKAPSAPIVSFQHGTIAAYIDAPTALELFDPETILYSALAAPGIISVAPDLLGFGASKSVLHPYYVEEPTALAVRDAVRAARDLASDKNIGFSGELFLAGYSEGGYATMATHKSLEAEPLEGMELIASFPASGGYDIKAMQEYFWKLDEYHQPFYMAFVAQAYKTTFAWSQPLSDMFNEPYATKIPALVNGSKTSSQINAELTDNIPALVKADLLENIDKDTKYKYIVDAFNANSLTDWKPTIPMFMYHGDADVTVPFNNSTITYTKLIANGASTLTVTLTPLPGADHSGGVFPYIEKMIPKVLSLMNQE
ncbi:MAG TPA: alpha/beta hydrolase [Cyclobacteriaceae bacterium]|nr:alpha/beta hydrolase [Cyclobacteriaceae bacterium]